MNVIERALSQVKALQPYTPGKPVEELERELGIKNSIKLASNENPLGCSEAAQAVVSQHIPDIWMYPDANAWYLKQELSKKLNVSANQLTIGNGSNDVLDLLARTFLTSGREAIYSEYSFLVYALVTQACGATAHVSKANPVDHQQPYGHNLEHMFAGINDQTAMIFIANPNNPTGTWLSRDQLYSFIKKVPEHILIVIDEAYFEYVQNDQYPDASKWLNEFANLVITRTFSKIYGLAGLRLGYAISSPEICDLLNRVRQPFNANSLALAAAVASLQDDDFVNRSVQNNLQGLQNLTAFCEQKGLQYIPSVGNFLTIKFADQTDRIYQQLLSKGVITRPVANYKLPDYLRVSIGTPEQMSRFTSELDSLI